MPPFVKLPHFFESIQDCHLALTVVSLMLQFLQGIFLGFKVAFGTKNCFGMGNVSEWLIVPRCTMLAYIVMIFRISSHRYFWMAACALKVKPKYLDTKIVNVLACLLSHVEFGTNIEKIAASIAAYGHRQHHPNTVLLVSGFNYFLQQLWIKISWIVLDQYFSFCHFSI